MEMKKQKIISDILEKSTLDKNQYNNGLSKIKQYLHFKNQYNKYSIRIKTIQRLLKFYEGNETWLKGTKMI
jgi:hypothetical protein